MKIVVIEQSSFKLKSEQILTKLGRDVSYEVLKSCPGLY